MSVIAEKKPQLEPLVDLALELCQAPVSGASIRRWATVGVLGRDGQMVRLKAKRIAGRLYAARADVEAFLAAVTAESNGAA